MTGGLVVDKKNELQEARENNSLSHPLLIRWFAKTISYIFHPVFIPLYIVYYALYVHNFIFLEFNPFNKIRVMIMAVLMFSFFPIVTTLLLKGLKFISSIHLNTQKDRIIPLIACGIYYFWIWNVWHNIPEYPHEINVFAMAVFLSSSIGLILNIYMKVSLHAIAAAVAVSFMTWLSIHQKTQSALYLSVAIFIAGLVCSARLIASNHFQREIYVGLFAGVIAFTLAAFFG